MNRLPQSQSRSRQMASRHGAAATEFAVCLPVIVVLIFGAIEACDIIYLKQSLTVAAYEAAREAISRGATSTTVRTNAETILNNRRITDGTVTISPRNIQSAKAGDYITISVSAPANSNSVLPEWFFKDQTIDAQASMMKEF